MGALLALHARRYLPILCLALLVPVLKAQSGTYAASAEYQGMIEELHTPAPSPIYLATGQRPLPDNSLKVKQHSTRTALTLKTPIDRNHHRSPGRHRHPAQPANARVLGDIARGSHDDRNHRRHHPPTKPMDNHQR